MSLLDATLAELGASFQLPSLTFNKHGVATLRLGDTDMLSLEKRDNAVLLSVTRSLPPHRRGLAEKALRVCGKESGAPTPVRAGLTRDNRLVLLARFTERTFTLPEAVRCINFLRDTHTRIGEL